MKIANITIDSMREGNESKLDARPSFNPPAAIHLSPIHSGLNVIYGPNGSGKSAVRHFLRELLFANRLRPEHRTQPSLSSGMVEVTDATGSVRLSHNPTMDRHRVSVQAVRGYNGQIPTIEQLTRSIDEETYNEIFNIGFREQGDEHRTLASLLISRFGVPAGEPVPRIDPGLIREREAAIARSRQLINELTQRRSTLLRQIAENESQHLAEIDSLTSQINLLTSRINDLHVSLQSTQRRLENLDLEIDDLRLQIERIRNQVKTIRIDRHTDRLPDLLAKLDAVMHQIVRWHKVHRDVQSQRNKLRDEMITWVSDDKDQELLLPYEEVRELLNSIEGRVGDLDEYVARYQHVVHRRDQDQHGGMLTDNMKATLTSMREEIYQLCRELNTQHLVYRRKMIVNELKQLRRCFVEVTDHVKRLVSRRDSLIQEIRKFDTARADLIMQSMHELCECNFHEQYLRESQPAPRETLVEKRVEVDVSAELARLHQLEDERRCLQADIDSLRADALDLQRRRDELIHRRESLRSVDIESLRRDLLEVERRLHDENRQLAALLSQLEADRRLTEIRPNALLDHASRLLQQLTSGDLQRVSIDRSQQIVAQNRGGKTVAYPALSRSGRDQTRLALCLAAARQLQQQGTEMPMVLDDVLINMDDESVRDAAAVLSEAARNGQQIILFTCHRQIASVIAGTETGVLELPDYHMGETVAPVERYSRPVRTSLVEREHVYDSIEPESLSTRSLVESTRYLYEQPPVVPSSAPITEFLRSDSRQVVKSSRSAAESLHSPQVDEATHLSDTRLISNEHIAVLRRAGIRTVGDLLNFDPSVRAELLSEADVDFDQIDAWQSQVLLMVAVPQLRATDAVLLYGCGVTDMERLSNLNADELQQRIRAFAESSRGRRMSASSAGYDRGRLNSWISSAHENRDRYRNRRRWSLGDSARSNRESIDRERSEPRQERQGFERQSLSREPRNFEPRNFESRAKEPRANESRTNDSRTNESRIYEPRESKRQIGETTRPATLLSDNEDDSSSLKFYLDLNSKIEAAPSIGASKAERLEKIGIATVKDLLENPAAEIATNLDYSRIGADDVRDWQHQATLVCRVPQLRGHDAQFLVACGITDPEKLANMQPEALFKVIGPFSRTKAGQRICRSGKAPDLAEVTDWINFAKQTRLLRAA
jgi:hypothetical protein